MECSTTEAGGTRCFTDHMMHALFFSGAVYAKSPGCVLRDLRHKFGNVVPVMHHGFDKDGEQAVFAARSGSGQVIIACRGTAGLKDVLQDLKYFHSRLPYAEGAAHWGFAERAQSVPVDVFCELLQSGEHIIFTGHSLGGAVASLLSLRVLKLMKGNHHQHQVRCITFGAPLFASRSLAEMINAEYKDVFTHVVGNKDFVPKILPVVSALQNVIYGHEDYLEGLSILGKGVSFLNWLPCAPLLQGLEKMIPLPFKLLLRCFLKLALPSTSWTYAFAGHVVVLDMDKQCSEDLLKVTCTEDLNVWYSQLNFAVAIGFDASQFMQHTTASYELGVMRALTRALSRHKHRSSQGGRLLRVQTAPVNRLYSHVDCPMHCSIADEAGGSPSAMLKVSVVEGNYELRTREGGESRSGGGHDDGHHPSAGSLTRQAMQYGLRSCRNFRGHRCHCRDVRQSSGSRPNNAGECFSEVSEEAAAWNCCSVAAKSPLMSFHRGSDFWPRRLTTESMKLRCWEYPVVNRFLVDDTDGACRRVVRSEMTMEVRMRNLTADNSSVCSTTSHQLEQCPSRPDCCTEADFVSSEETKETKPLDNSSPGQWSGCRVCESMQVSKAYGQQTKRTALVQKKSFDIGCVIRVIGQCSRHRRAVKNFCFFTFCKIIMGHLLG